MNRLLIILTMAAILLTTPSPAEPAVLEVEPPGGIGALGDVYTSIQQAIDDAIPGDTISVADGVYEDDTVGPDGHLVIDKANLTLESVNGKGSTTINVANGVGIDIRAGASGFTLGGQVDRGFTINGGTDTGFVIQLVNGPSGVEISHNTINTTGNASQGVSIGAAGADDLTVSENDFTADASDGCIWAPRVVNFTVSDNTFDGGAYAIQTNGVTSNSQSLISGNEITNATGSGGIVIGSGEGTSDLTISDNTITGCTNQGIYLADYCAQGTAGDMTTVTVEDNTLSTNDKGIRITDGAHVLASNFTIQNNCITGNTTYGLQNQHTSEFVNAELNAWGHASGPYHAIINATGAGDNVSDNVDIYPWYIDCTFTTLVDLPVHNVTQDIYYHTIQSAVDGANPGDIIVAAAGTYDEQIIIDTGLTLKGAGDTTIIEPSATTIENMSTYDYLSKTFTPVVYVSAASAVTIQDLKIDGSQAATLPLGTQNYVGLFLVGTDATIDTVSSVDFLNYPGSMLGYNMYAYANSETVSVEIDTCTMSGVGRGGIQCVGDGLTMNIHDCNVIGPGVRHSGEWIANGILIWDLATGAITDNNVSDFAYDGTGWCAQGIDASGATSVTGNTVTDCQYGIGAWGDGWDTPSATISGNIVSADGLAGSEGDGVSGIIVDAWGGGTASVTISENNLGHCGPGDGITLGGEYDDPDAIDATISKNTITNWNTGIFIGDSSNAITVTDNTISSTNTGSVGIKIPATTTAASMAIYCNSIAGNDSYGVISDATGTVDAELNWWGDSTGPSGDGGGTGDAVSGDVDFFPWLLSNDCNAFTIIVADYVVDDDWVSLPDWSTVTVGGTDYYIGLNAFDTIQKAIDAASDGNNISVAAGTYNEAVLIDKSLNIRGATADLNKNGYDVPAGYAWDDTVESIINHPNPSGGYITIVDIYDVNDVTFEGFVVQELNAEANKNSSLLRVYAHTKEISNINVRNNVIGGNTNVAAQDGKQGRMGLYIVNHPYSDKGVVNSTFAGNKIFDCKGNGDNVFIWSAYFAYGAPGPASMRGTVIEDNEIYGSHRAGIETAGGYTDLTIRRNMIYGNSGLISDDPNHLKYGNGILLIRGSGDKLGGPTTAYGPVNLTIKGNEIFGNEKNGIYSGPILSGVSITGNEIYDNGWDAVRVDLEGTYWNPTFEPEPNDWSCYDGASDVEVSFNNLLDNGSGVKVVGIPTNGFVVDAEYNFWGDVSGPHDPNGTTETDGITCHSVDVIKNADGAGDGVSDYADYCPWLAVPVISSTSPCPVGDLDGDCDVDFFDFAMMAANWLEGTEP